MRTLRFAQKDTSPFLSFLLVLVQQAVIINSLFGYHLWTCKISFSIQITALVGKPVEVTSDGCFYLNDNRILNDVIIIRNSR